MSPHQTTDSLPLVLQEVVRREVERQLQQTRKTFPIDDPPMLQQLGHIPRMLPLSVWLYLRMCPSVGSVVGWFLAGIGFIFPLIAAIVGLDDLFPRNWVEAGKGTVIRIEPTRVTINECRICAYHFETTDPDGAEKVTGISYGNYGKHEIGDEVPILKSGQRYRVHDLVLSQGGYMFSLLFLGAGLPVGIIGLCMPIYAWFAAGKAIHLLQNGTATGARYHAINPTGTIINGRQMMGVDLEYHVAGETYMASATAIDTSRLTDGRSKIVFYDPTEPKKSVVLEGYNGMQIDELTGQFWINPLRCVLPLLAAGIVGAEIVTFIVLAMRAI
jgi:hypothetical protein